MAIADLDDGAGSNCASGSGNAVHRDGHRDLRPDHRQDRERSTRPGRTVAYTVTVTNSGQTAYTGATFTDPLRPVLANAVYNANAGATGGTCPTPART